MANFVKDYLNELDWRVRENSNASFSYQGLNQHVATSVVSKYWLEDVYSKDVANAHRSGAMHIHDLGMLTAYCCGWDLYDLLSRGFGGVYGKVQASPPKHFSSALGQLVNFMYTMAGELAGAVAVSNFDTLLAPFVRYDKLEYSQVKQFIQEFVYNMNAPTRLGFQCLSEDTEILTSDGWKNHSGVLVGDSIKTFNIDTQSIEDCIVDAVFSRNYVGIMYNLKNRTQDQLISPGHRVVRKVFNTEKYCIEKIEDVLNFKSDPKLPIAGNNVNKDSDIPDDYIRIAAWIIADGTREKDGSNRITIAQSEIVKPDNYHEIINCLNSLKLKYTIGESIGLGSPVKQIRLNPKSSQWVLDNIFRTRKSVKFVPKMFFNMSERQSRLFIETYMKADGTLKRNVITTTHKEILDGLQVVIVNCGYGFSVTTREPYGISKKLQYRIAVVKHKDTYIARIETVDYNGIIWCPSTKNGTVIARRNGKVFITGNSVFSNLTMDLTPSPNYVNECVVIGGELQNQTYGEFQTEMDLINKAFCEVMLEGDSKGRVFTFPIPTYNLHKEFQWENQELLWKMTGKYGVPYFANFINSDLRPEDTRSMCCRLRLDRKQLTKRSGGLFAASALTGSVGVVTINVPRIAYKAQSTEEFYTMLSEVMELAKESLEVKRALIEDLTEKGLYPYSTHYLDGVYAAHKKYWYNHFSTIGLVGMNEACLNLLKVGIDTEEGKQFSEDVLEFMLAKISEYQNETGNLYNLEASPCESATYRMAKSDKKLYPDIITAGAGETPFYSNSTQLPVDTDLDIIDVLEHQNSLQKMYTGGTVVHLLLGESVNSWETVRDFVRMVATQYEIPYFTLTPTFSVCKNHGYINGEVYECPQCNEETEVYSRVVGYLRPTKNWNDAKQLEFKERTTYKIYGIDTNHSCDKMVTVDR